jgi:hypothetical protein
VIGAEDGARTLAVLLAVKKAAREGRVVEVTEMLEGL